MAVTKLSEELSIDGRMVRVAVLWDDSAEPESVAKERLRMHLERTIARHKKM